MKKWLKIWMLTMAFLATMTAVVSTGKVQADQDASKVVQVTITEYNGWNNNCTLEDYIFSFDASTQSQNQTTGHDIVCKFWNATGVAVTLQLQGDLTNLDGAIISSGNVKVTNGTWNDNPSDLGEETSVSGLAINGEYWQTLFNKTGNTIWDATWVNVEITVTVPGWTPNGTYEGTLVLTF